MSRIYQPATEKTEFSLEIKKKKSITRSIIVFLVSVPMGMNWDAEGLLDGLLAEMS